MRKLKCSEITEIIFFFLITHELKILRTAQATKVCIGSEAGYLWDFTDQYRGCTHLVGNLVLRNYDMQLHGDPEGLLDFLQGIEEITGYLLITNFHFHRLAFSNLHTIRGMSLLRIHVDDPEYALLVEGSKIEQLEFPSLREISSGSVGLYFEKRMCYLESINWRDIIDGEGAKFHYYSAYDNNMRLYVEKIEDNCDKCNSRCEGGCWGKGADQCQQLSKVHCSSECGGGRCFGAALGQCCHSSCIGGCSGPNRTDCVGCRIVNIDGECQDGCPPKTFAYATRCVKKCPEGTVVDEKRSTCLFKCPSNQYPKNGKCEIAHPPSKLCQQPQYSNFVHSGNIDYFRDCTILDGNIQIDEFAFFRAEHWRNYTSRQKLEPLYPDQLAVFNTLQEIIGTLAIESELKSLEDLTHFKNLKAVGRPKLASSRHYALQILGTSLKSIDLSKLRHAHGIVEIKYNPNLCYVDSVNWTALTNGNGPVLIESNSPAQECQKDNNVCSSDCSRDGCWGPQPENCVCVGYKNDTECVSQCPKGTHISDDGCLKCHESCRSGCSGPLNTLGDNGCQRCHQAILHANGTMTCMLSGVPCPDGYCQQNTKVIIGKSGKSIKLLARSDACKKCIPVCIAQSPLGCEVAGENVIIKGALFRVINTKRHRS